MSKHADSITKPVCAVAHQSTVVLLRVQRCCIYVPLRSQTQSSSHRSAALPAYSWSCWCQGWRCLTRQQRSPRTTMLRHSHTTPPWRSARGSQNMPGYVLVRRELREEQMIRWHTSTMIFICKKKPIKTRHTNLFKSEWMLWYIIVIYYELYNRISNIYNLQRITYYVCMDTNNWKIKFPDWNKTKIT